MQKTLIFGNSGSGKSTLAKIYSEKFGISHLDLDSLAWSDTSPPVRKPINESAEQINTFTDKNKSWVIEGGYSDLLEILSTSATEIIFLNPGVETCIENCKNRPWEPHKYETAEAQNNNLEMLLNWVKEYYIRDDAFSFITHQMFFEHFKGKKTQYQSNKRNE